MKSSRLRGLALLAAVLAFLPASPAAPAVDLQVFTRQDTPATTLASPNFSTTGTNKLLLAFLASDGPAGGGTQSFTAVNGGGLTWRLRRRTNVQAGTAEIWQAVAATPVTNVNVTATRASGAYAGSFTLVVFSGASTTVDGATAGASAVTGAPAVTLTTIRPDSWVWAVGTDWDRAVARTIGANQTKVEEFLASVGDTFWVQRQNNPTSAAGTPVTLNATAPTNDQFNLASIEVVAAASDTLAPTPPTNLTANATGPTQVNLAWTASTDDTGVTRYNILRNGSAVGTATTPSFSDTTVTPQTTYNYTVTAQDAAGNISSPSNTATATTPAIPSDTSPPTVSLTAPANNATVSGTVAVTATAADNVAVVGVRFTLDGSNLGAEDTVAPYSTSWLTSGVANGTHVLTAIARDTAGNTTTSTLVTVTVNNSDTTPPTAPATLSALGGVGFVNLTWAAATDNTGVASYNLHRSTTAGFAPALANRIAQLGGGTTSYSDSGLAVGTYYYKATAADAAGNTGPASNEASAVVTGAPVPTALAVDLQVFTRQNTPATTLASPTFSTTGTNKLLLAFLASDGPETGGTQSFSAVNGGGLTWRLRQRTNTQAGTAEIWQAVAAAPLTNVTVTATRASGAYAGSFTLVVFSGANTAVDGATGSANAVTGAPAVTLTTTRPGSWVWAVGIDWDRAVTRTIGANQTKVEEFLASVGDTFWVQRQDSATAIAGTPVTLNVTAPTNDRWNFSSIEVVAAATDTLAPTPPTNLTANAIGPTQVNLAWTASTDDTAVTRYNILRNGSPVGTATTPNFSDTSVAPQTTYNYTVTAQDAAGNISGPSNTATATTPGIPADTTPPTISLTAPANNATVSGTVAVTATAADNVAVVGVRITLDGSNLGAEDTVAPYSTSWLTSGVANGTHVLTAIARDAAGNTTTSTLVTVTVNNSDTTPPTVSLTAPANNASVTGTVTVSATAADNVAVSGVQFLLDGSPLGTEDTTAPYSITWDTTTAANGAHVVTARARDAAGNTTTSAARSVTASNIITDPAIVGQWTAPATWPLVAIHLTLLNNGKILMWDGGRDCLGSITDFVWDPATNAFTQVNLESQPFISDMFCSSQSVMADGRVLVAGGHECNDPGFVGDDMVNIFNPATNQWSFPPDMFYRRWYPSTTVLPDGRVLVTAGSDVTVDSYIPFPEVYDPVTNSWTLLTTANRVIPNYPFMFVLPDGRVLAAGSDEAKMGTYALNLTTKTWSTIDPTVLDAGSAVMHLPGKVMKSGSSYLSPPIDNGGNVPSAATTYVMDATLGNPAWRQTASMNFARTHHNLTILPDGIVLCTGGSSVIGGIDPATGVLPSETWNPATEAWTVRASGQRARMYHSTALLLPDGRVLVAGSGHNWANDYTEYTAEIYSPPYLFKGPRPTLTSVPSTLTYNTEFVVATPDAAGIASVSLIRNGAVTHSVNMDQRFVPLSFRVVAGGIAVTAPANANLAPPGYYMLFAVNTQGVPSLAPFVRLPVPSPDTTPPTAPSSLTAVGGLGSVNLTWAAATDNVGVSSYNLHRSTTPGFLPAIANRVVQLGGATTSYSDTGLTAGTYYYKATAADAVGNIGPVSNEASAVVTGAPTPPSPTVDLQVFTRQNTPATTLASPTFSTTGTNKLLLAFLASDGPAAGGTQSFSTVNGGGLTWRLRRRTNTQAGTAEIWQAVAATPVTNVTVTATRASGAYAGSFTLVVFSGASTTVDGATAGASAVTGAPAVTLTTTRPGSVVWGVGTDWDRAVSRTIGTNQTKVEEFLASVGDTFWVQRQNNPVPVAGTAVTLNATAPIDDQFNFSSIEIVPQ